MLGPRKHVVESILWVFQFLFMRDETAGLHGEYKVPGRDVSPGFECLNRGKAVKAVIQFQAVKVADIIFEHLRRRRFRRIKGSYPMLVVIAGGANADISRHAVNAMSDRSRTLQRQMQLQPRSAIVDALILSLGRCLCVPAGTKVEPTFPKDTLKRTRPAAALL